MQRRPTNYESDNYSDLGSEDEQPQPQQYSRRPQDTSMSAMAQMQRQQQQPNPTAPLFSQKKANDVVHVVSANKPQYQDQRTFVERPVDDDATSRSSTLDGNEEDVPYPSKKSLAPSATKMSLTGQEPVSPAPAPHVPGPLESQLAALMSKLVYIEQSNPAISIKPEEYEQTMARLKALEDEKKTWWKRHDAIWALRDEDVENNIKIRVSVKTMDQRKTLTNMSIQGLLASCRRELDATKKLRDEDLINVQIVRSKLAEKTREVERLHAQTGRSSPSRGRPGSFLERRDTTDLFTAAKVAALEQRALELEKRNSDLVAQLGAPRGGSIDDLNRSTAHQAWKGTVADLESKIRAKDAELERLRSQGASGGSGQMDWYRIEALLEEHATYRESIGGKLQALRSEKEELMRDLHRKENDCQVLELKVQTLQRRANVV